MNTYPCFSCGHDIEVPGMWTDSIGKEFICPGCQTVNSLAHDCGGGDYSDEDDYYDEGCLTYFEAP